MRKRQPIQKTVKDTVDLVFELTTSTPGGYTLNVKDFGYVGARVVKILVNRGILEKTNNHTFPKSYMYKWAVASAPTKVLYGSIAQEMSDFYKKKNMKTAAKKSAGRQKPEQVEIETSEPIVETPIVAPTNPLAPFSIQDLWDEIKRRGGTIDNNRLVIIFE